MGGFVPCMFFTEDMSWASHRTSCVKGHELPCHILPKVNRELNHGKNATMAMKFILHGVHHGTYALGWMHPVVCNKCDEVSAACTMVQHRPNHGLPHGVFHGVSIECGLGFFYCSGSGPLVRIVSPCVLACPKHCVVVIPRHIR